MLTAPSLELPADTFRTRHAAFAAQQVDVFNQLCEAAKTAKALKAAPKCALGISTTCALMTNSIAGFVAFEAPRMHKETATGKVSNIASSPCDTKPPNRLAWREEKSGLSVYELARKRNIDRNKKVLSLLGLSGQYRPSIFILCFFFLERLIC